MVAGQDAAEDIGVGFISALPDDVAHPQPDIAKKQFVTGLRRPLQIVALIVDAALVSCILHDLFTKAILSGRGVNQSVSTRACGQSGFPSGLISESNFPNGGLNERAALCGDGSCMAAT